jgi:subtilisin family serine protease
MSIFLYNNIVINKREVNIMKKVKFFLVLIFCLVLFASFVHAEDSTNKLIVQLKEGTSLNLPNEIVNGQKPTPENLYNSILYRKLSSVGNIEIILTPKEYINNVIMLLRKNNDVIYVEQDSYYKSDSLTSLNDPYFNSYQTYFNTIGALQGIENIYTENITANNEVIVAVIDSGVNKNHEDLAGILWVNTDEIPNNGLDDDNNGFIDDINGINLTLNGDNSLIDEIGHGTIINSIISANINNSIGLAGLSKAKILNCDVIKDRTVFGDLSESDVVTCVDYIVQMKQRGYNIVAVNMSFNSSTLTQTGELYIKTLHDNNILAVVSAGNSNINLDTNPISPASFSKYYDNVITVGASNEKGEKASFSNYGKYTVSLFAPGEYILGASNTVNDGYVTSSGTSFSAPIVAAIIAGIKEKHPEYTYTQVKSLLLSTVKELPSLKEISKTGGIVQYYNSSNGGVSNCITDKANKLVVDSFNISGFDTLKYVVHNYNCEQVLPIISYYANSTSPVFDIYQNTEPLGGYVVKITNMNQQDVISLNNFSLFTPMFQLDNITSKTLGVSYNLTDGLLPGMGCNVFTTNSHNILNTQYTVFSLYSNGVISFYKDINDCLNKNNKLIDKAILDSTMYSLDLPLLFSTGLDLLGDYTFFMNANNDLKYTSFLEAINNVLLQEDNTTLTIQFNNRYNPMTTQKNITNGLIINNDNFTFYYTNIEESYIPTGYNGIYVQQLGQFYNLNSLVENNSNLFVELKSVNINTIQEDNSATTYFSENQISQLPDFIPVVFTTDNNGENNIKLTFNSKENTDRFTILGNSINSNSNCISWNITPISDTVLNLNVSYNMLDSTCTSLVSDKTAGYILYINSIFTPEIKLQYAVNTTDGIEEIPTDNITDNNTTNTEDNTTYYYNDPTGTSSNNGGSGGGSGGCASIRNIKDNEHIHFFANFDIMFLLLGWTMIRRFKYVFARSSVTL